MPNTTLSPELVEKILNKVEENTRTEFIRIKTRVDKETSLIKSKFGGVPYWPDIKTYPKAEDGTMLTLLAQINLSDLPKNDILPDRGLLQFFIQDAIDMDNYKVVLHDRIDESVKLADLENAVPTSLMQGVTEHTVDGRFVITEHPAWKGCGFPVTRELGMEFSTEHDSVNTAEAGFLSEFVKAAKELGIQVSKGDAADCITDEVCERLYDTSIGHKLFGHPCFTQGDPRTDEDQILLFQIDPYAGDDISGQADERNHIEIGDSGTAGFFIEKDDLKKLDFSHILYSWACY